MGEKSIFYDEWRRCLREHYKDVVRSQDKTTEASLRKVLAGPAVNFSEAELKALYREATLRADELPDDFLPDMDRALPPEWPPESAPATMPDRTFQPHPAECACALCSPLREQVDAALEAGHDAEGQPLPPDYVPEIASGNIFAVMKPEPIVEELAEELDEDTSDEGVSAGDEPDPDAPRQMSLF